jgi:hypothetical protein
MFTLSRICLWRGFTHNTRKMNYFRLFGLDWMPIVASRAKRCIFTAKKKIMENEYKFR